MTYDQNNIFAKILRGEIPCDKVYEDEDVFDLLVPYLTYNSKKKMWYDQNSKYNRVINKKIKSLGIY